MYWKTKKESNQEGNKRVRRIEFEGRTKSEDKLREKERQTIVEVEINKKMAIVCRRYTTN